MVYDARSVVEGMAETPDIERSITAHGTQYRALAE
jgi:hypothetical protein